MSLAICTSEMDSSVVWSSLKNWSCCKFFIIKKSHELMKQSISIFDCVKYYNFRGMQGPFANNNMQSIQTTLFILQNNKRDVCPIMRNLWT